MYAVKSNVYITTQKHMTYMINIKWALWEHVHHWKWADDVYWPIHIIKIEKKNEYMITSLSLLIVKKWMNEFNISQILLFELFSFIE
jgi:hypothetical protein